MGQWVGYHQMVGDRANSMVVGTLNDFVTRREACLDLGAGNLRDSKFLLWQGFSRVVAVDSSEDSLPFATEGIELHIMPIEQFVPEKDAFDFAFSANTFFFLSPTQIANALQNVLNGLRAGGIMAFNVLGKEDGWVVMGEQVSSFTEESLKALCVGFEVLGVGEGRNQAKHLNSFGILETKFWHTISIVLRKP